MRSHMDSLSAKSYWDGLTVTPDFVVMFVPAKISTAPRWSATLSFSTRLSEAAFCSRPQRCSPG